MSADPTFVHPSTVVDEPVTIGLGTKIWHFCHVCAGATIGQRVSIGQNGYIGGRVIIGDGCRIQNNVSLYDGVELAPDVFVGPSVVFTNVTNPRATISRRDEFKRTRVLRGATIGANATLVPGITLGAHSFIAAGAVVTKDVPAFALMGGVPARQIGWVSEEGHRLSDDPSFPNRLFCPVTGKRYCLSADGLVPAGPSQMAPMTSDTTPH